MCVFLRSNFIKRLIMKKIVLLISLVCVALSCTEDRIAKIEAEDVLGTWNLVEVIDNGDVVDLNSCDLMDNITFTRTQITEVFYSEVEDSDECATITIPSVYRTEITDDGLEVYGTDEEGVEDYFGIITIDGDRLTFNEEASGSSRITAFQIRTYQRQ